MEVIIENTSAQLHGIPRSTGKLQAGALLQTNIVTLKPGVNVVDAEKWAEAKKHQMVKIHMEEGTFKELKEVSSLTELAPAQAQKYIELSVDSKMLFEWERMEKRTKVKKLLNNRLEDLEKPEPGTKPPEMKGKRE